MTREALEAEIAEIRAARIKLAKGQSRVSIAHSLGGNNMVNYTPANMPDLIAIERELKWELAKLLGQPTGRAFHIS